MGLRVRVPSRSEMLSPIGLFVESAHTICRSWNVGCERPAEEHVRPCAANSLLNATLLHSETHVSCGSSAC